MKRILEAVAFVAVLVFGWASLSPSTAEGGYDPPGTFGYSTGTSMPQAGVLIHTGATVLGGILAWNASGGTAYLQCWDRTTQPSTGTAPVWSSASCATNSFCQMVAVPAGGVKLSAGLYCGFSSTGPTYTQAAGASTGFYAALWR
jgi:hypothetical protein